MQNNTKSNKTVLIIVIAVLVVALIAAAVIYFVTRGGEKYTVGVNKDDPYAFFSAGLTEEGFFEGIKASDYVKLPDYKGLTVPENTKVPDQDEVERQIKNSVLAEYALGVPVIDRAVADGDTVNIDYVGYKDGVAFDGGSTQGMGTEVTIGVTNYIEGFLEQLPGHEPGETFDIFVTFPENYGNADLAGADARFNITINYIVEYDYPDAVTDEMAWDYGFDTAEELIADVEAWVLNASRNNFFDTYLEAVELIRLPESVKNYFENYLVGYYYAAYGYELSGDEMKEVLESNEESLRDSAMHALAIQAIAEREGLTVSQEDVAQAGIDRYVDTYGVPYVRQQALGSVTVPAFVAENGVTAELVSK